MWMGVWLKLDKSVTGRSTGALVITLPGGLGSLERDAQPQTLTPDPYLLRPSSFHRQTDVSGRSGFSSSISIGPIRVQKLSA